MAEVSIDLRITVDGKIYTYHTFDEFGYSIPATNPTDQFGRVDEIADSVHRALWDGDEPKDSLKHLMENGLD